LTLSGRSLGRERGKTRRRRPAEFEAWVELLATLEGRVREFSRRESDDVRAAVEAEAKRYEEPTDANVLGLRQLADAKLLAIDRCVLSDVVEEEEEEDTGDDAGQIHAHLRVVDTLVEVEARRASREHQVDAEKAELRERLAAKEAEVAALARALGDERARNAGLQRRVEDAVARVKEDSLRLKEAQDAVDVATTTADDLKRQNGELKRAVDVALASCRDATMEVDALRAALDDAAADLRDARRAKALAEESSLLLSNPQDDDDDDDDLLKKTKDHMIDELTAQRVDVEAALAMERHNRSEADRAVTRLKDDLLEAQLAKDDLKTKLNAEIVRLQNRLEEEEDHHKRLLLLDNETKGGRGEQQQPLAAAAAAAAKGPQRQSAVVVVVPPAAGDTAALLDDVRHLQESYEAKVRRARSDVEALHSRTQSKIDHLLLTPERPRGPCRSSSFNKQHHHQQQRTPHRAAVLPPTLVAPRW